MTDDYKKPYKMFEVLGTLELKDLYKEIETYQNIDRKNVVFQEYWRASKVLCEITIDKKLREDQQSNATDQLSIDLGNEEKLCQDDELEKEAEEMLQDKTEVELIEL